MPRPTNNVLIDRDIFDEEYDLTIGSDNSVNVYDNELESDTDCETPQSTDQTVPVVAKIGCMNKSFGSFKNLRSALKKKNKKYKNYTNITSEQ